MASGSGLGCAGGRRAEAGGLHCYTLGVIASKSLQAGFQCEGTSTLSLCRVRFDNKCKVGT